MSLLACRHDAVHQHNDIRIIKASEALGIPYVEDLNSPLHPTYGCAKMHFAVDAKGYRSSTLEAFLPKYLAIARMRHLHVCTNAAVTKICMESDEKDTPTARGVYVQTAKSKGPRPCLVRARKEVILSAGPIGSPQVLMLRYLHWFLSRLSCTDISVAASALKTT